MEYVDDAFEGRSVAMYWGKFLGEPYSCFVRGKKCHDRDQFNELVGEFMGKQGEFHQGTKE
jgi:hypothetical protein